jgi:hypothetical protein
VQVGYFEFIILYLLLGVGVRVGFGIFYLGFIIWDLLFGFGFIVWCLWFVVYCLV